MVPSGVGSQAKYLIEGLLATGRYRFVCAGGAVKHPDYTPQKIAPEKYGDDWVIYPVDGYGDKNFVRQTLLRERPDVVVMFTDPRFFVWLWEMEDEVRQFCPIVYWHVWDNDPTPTFNRVFYESTDHIVALSLKTLGLLQDMGYERRTYIPHALPEELFKPLPEEQCARFKHDTFGPHRDRRFIALWNNRNARRKQTGDVIATFAKFADRVGRENVAMLMHTAPDDPEGQDIHAVAKCFGIDGNLIISNDRVEPAVLNGYYNACDVTMNISCFPAGMKVTTIDGYRPIEEISEGDLVLTHRGRFMPVVRTFSGRNSRPLYRIKTSNNDPIVATEEHKLFVVKKDDVKFLIHENISLLRELVREVLASDVSIGDYLISSEFIETAPPVEELDVWSSVSDKKSTVYGHSTYALVDGSIVHSTGNSPGKFVAHEKLRVDEDLAYIFGEWVADGSTNSCTVSFNKKDVSRAELLREKFERVFGSPAFIREGSRHNDVVLKEQGVYSRFLVDHCGAYSEGKRVPSCIMRGSEAVKRAFIAGYMAGDGCDLTHPQYGSRTNRIRTVSSQLASEMRRLLFSLGYCPSTHDDENLGSFKQNARIWTVEWRERKHSNNGSCRSWNDGRGVISRVYDVDVLENEDGVDVYNIEVAVDNSYTVSNCSVRNSNEGFGLGTLESLFAGTPILAHFTGGLQFQLGDWWDGRTDFTDQDEMTTTAKKLWRSGKCNWWGVPIFPASRSCTGSQQIPFIYDDRVSHDDVVDGLVRLYDMSRAERRALGLRAREWAVKNFNMRDMVASWDRVLGEQVLKHRQAGVVRHRVTSV